MSPKIRRSFLVDENTSRTLVTALRNVGYLAQHVHEVGLQGHPDSEVYSYAQSHQQTIITIDLDFSNILRFIPPHYGIIVLRLSNSTTTADLIQEVLNGLRALEEQELANTLIIIERGRLRVRRQNTTQ
jgi:predicted nuclease of predicted toxin-antitoxin system